MRLSTRLALAVGVTVPLLVLATGWLLLHLVADDLRAGQRAQLRARATAVTQNANRYLHAVEDGQTVVADKSRRRLETSARDMGVRLTGADVAFTAGPQPDADVRLPDRAPDPVAAHGGGESWHVLSRRVHMAGRDGAPNLWIYSPDSAYEEDLSVVRERVVTVTLLAAPVAGAVTWAVAAGAVRPLRRFQRRTSGLDPRDGGTRLAHTPTGVTEVDELARTVRTVLARYDEQAARTGEALATARSFTTAASHELRTPLMSMRTNLDVLTAHPGLDPRDRAEVLADLDREHARLLGLLTMLRALGRGDLVEADAFGPVDLAELVAEAAAGLRRAHAEAEVSVRAGEQLLVHGWELGLRSAVDNLLANAWTHGRTSPAPAPAPVRVEVALRAHRAGERTEALLTVADHGPGVPAEHRARVFARFHRGPDSPGSGLGLTLVAQQVALHRGTVTVADRPDGRPGAHFAVRLPATGATTGDAAAAHTAVEHTLPLLRRDWLTDATTPAHPDPRTPDADRDPPER
ncbi:HAMP domain-containing sensor histidine kinase [Streptomyces sp. Z26]|uniref:sensor histidine kinase n=1 Tax=Streptomyces sp. Z26 TaxID=2500177 RepID=UPI000EF139DD|nr:HAMP domain-containing sensor histidine kinase [Streptomyces sp. Z26]RLL65947.1 sensor histidine kinase [Streptomyces sp. Z26]